MSQDQRVAIEALQGWSWDPLADAWQAMVDTYTDYVAETGRTAIAPKTIYSGVGMGTWVHNQRANYRAGHLSPERIAALEAVSGWRWEPRTAPDRSANK